MRDNLAVHGIPDDEPKPVAHGRKPRRIIPIYCRAIKTDGKSSWRVWKRYRTQDHANQAFTTICKNSWWQDFYEFSLTNPEENEYAK